MEIHVLIDVHPVSAYTDDELRHSVQLGAVQETLLVPLYAGPSRSWRKHPIFKAFTADGMVKSIDWNFQRFN